MGTFLPEWAQVRDFAVRAEELGFDAYWANDHPLRSMDCWTQLAALATVTTRLRLIALVSCVYYRSPALIARQAADVDRISGGRLVLGLGTGDDAAEFGQLGLRFPAAPERLAALAEAAGIIRGMWAGPVTHAGPHFQVTDAHVRPGPVQQPGVPVLIGGGGERTTLRLVARYADVSNFGPHEWTGGAYDLAAVRRKYEVLRGYCRGDRQALRRDPAHATTHRCSRWPRPRVSWRASGAGRGSRTRGCAPSRCSPRSTRRSCTTRGSSTRACTTSSPPSTAGTRRRRSCWPGR